MTRQWIFLINPFLTATRDSYRKMKQIGDYTVAALAAYATNTLAKMPAVSVSIFNDLVAALTPLSQNYDAAYEQWISQQGIQKGKTRSLAVLFDELRGDKIEEWDLAIQNVYRQNTPEYIALMPHRRTPFQVGSQQDRLTAVGALSLSIGNDAALQTLKTQVDEFYDELVTANTVQKGSKTKKSGDSGDVEAQRITLGTELYSVLGSLMTYFKETPETIGNFFLLQAIRNHEQTTFKHDIKGSETLLALTRTFDAGDQLKLVNRGHAALQTALVHEKNDAMPSTALTLQPNEEEIVPPEALGPAGNRFLIVKNMSETEKGAYTIDIV